MTEMTIHMTKGPKIPQIRLTDRRDMEKYLKHKLR